MGVHDPHFRRVGTATTPCTGLALVAPPGVDAVAVKGSSRLWAGEPNRCSSGFGLGCFCFVGMPSLRGMLGQRGVDGWKHLRASWAIWWLPPWQKWPQVLAHEAFRPRAASCCAAVVIAVPSMAVQAIVPWLDPNGPLPHSGWRDHGALGCFVSRSVWLDVVTLRVLILAIRLFCWALCGLVVWLHWWPLSCLGDHPPAHLLAFWGIPCRCS